MEAEEAEVLLEEPLGDLDEVEEEADLRADLDDDEFLKHALDLLESGGSDE